MRRLSDEALLAGTRSLASRERRVTAELVAHLGEIESRSLFQRKGYSSLFVYCRDALGLSEHEAYGRIEAAGAARRFPLALEMLREGALTLTAVSLLAPHLTLENHRAVLESARGKKKSEVEEIVATLNPAPDVPATLRKQPTAPAARNAGSVGESARTPELELSRVGSSPVVATAVQHLSGAVTPKAASPRTPPPAPLSPGRYRYQLTIDKETRDLLQRAKDLSRHVAPGGDDAGLMKRALQLLVDDLVRKRIGDGISRRSGRRGADPGSRHVPAEVRRAVYLRDQGRCAFLGRHGHRCEERGMLEFHHVKPYAIGGEATEVNIELRCRRHNQYEARVYFARQEACEQGRATSP